MAGPTNTREQAMLNAEHDVAGRYVGLFTAAPDDTGGGTEVTTAGGTLYARVAIAATDWNAASGTAPATKTGPKAGVSWVFPTAGASWGTATHWGIFSASSAGTLLHWGALQTALVIGTGQTVQFDETHLITHQLGDPTDTF